MLQKFDLNDILIEPAIISDITSRKDVNIYDANGMLPIFTAPMFDVVSNDNHHKFVDNKIYSIIPRKPTGTYTMDDFYSTTQNKWQAVGLEDFNHFFNNDNIYETYTSKVWVLIDMANGHMKHLYDSVLSAKLRWGSKLVLMVGNIANPYTYKMFSAIGADCCRLSIGSGSACLTSVQTAIGYPMGSLISECAEIRNELKESGEKHAKIIADGGISTYSDIIKSIALGADYVMMGGTLNKSIESASPIFIEIRGGIKVQPVFPDDAPEFSDVESIKEYIKRNYYEFNDYKLNIKFLTGETSIIELSHEDFADFTLWKRYRGMSTKEVQQELGNKIMKTSEGIIKYNKVEYSLRGWTENFIHYLSSAMSYTGFDDLKDFISGPDWNLITHNSYLRINK